MRRFAKVRTDTYNKIINCYYSWLKALRSSNFWSTSKKLLLNGYILVKCWFRGRLVYRTFKICYIIFCLIINITGILHTFQITPLLATTGCDISVLDSLNNIVHQRTRGTITNVTRPDLGNLIEGPIPNPRLSNLQQSMINHLYSRDPTTLGFEDAESARQRINRNIDKFRAKFRKPLDVVVNASGNILKLQAYIVAPIIERLGYVSKITTAPSLANWPNIFLVWLEDYGLSFLSGDNRTSDGYRFQVLKISSGSLPSFMQAFPEDGLNVYKDHRWNSRIVLSDLFNKTRAKDTLFTSLEAKKNSRRRFLEIKNRTDANFRREVFKDIVKKK